MKDMGLGTATGKIILMGEHAVVFGEPAIAFPFNGTSITATIIAADDNWLDSSYHVGPLTSLEPNLTNLYELTNKLQNDLQTVNFSIKITSTIPAERGMGSSAAVAVAITRAFFDWQELPLSEEVLLSYVNFSEKIAHGNPSGLDATTTSGQHPIYFKKGQPANPFPLRLDAYLIVADTGIKGQTRAAVQSVADLRMENKDFVDAHIQQLGHLTHEARLAIMNNQPVELGELMNQAQASLKEIGVSNEELDTYIQVALNAGALGAKLTGGGRGGCFIVLTKSKHDAEKICEQLKIAGVPDTWLQGLGVFQYA